MMMRMLNFRIKFNFCCFRSDNFSLLLLIFIRLVFIFLCFFMLLIIKFLMMSVIFWCHCSSLWLLFLSYLLFFLCIKVDYFEVMRMKFSVLFILFWWVIFLSLIWKLLFFLLIFILFLIVTWLLLLSINCRLLLLFLFVFLLIDFLFFWVGIIQNLISFCCVKNKFRYHFMIWNIFCKKIIIKWVNVLKNCFLLI